MVKHLFVIDVQNEFCHPDGNAPIPCRTSLKEIEANVDNIEKTIHFWRNQGWPVVFTQAIGDKEYLSKTQYNRYLKMGKLGFLKNNGWSSGLYRVSPLKEEKVFKKGGYDPFFSQEFKSYVLSNVENMVLCGFYSDVCVDATARSADQYGIQTEIIANCSNSMFRAHEDALEFMNLYYGTIIHRSLHEFRKLSANS